MITDRYMVVVECLSKNHMALDAVITNMLLEIASLSDNGQIGITTTDYKEILIDMSMFRRICSAISETIFVLRQGGTSFDALSELSLEELELCCIIPIVLDQMKVYNTFVISKRAEGLW